VKSEELTETDRTDEADFVFKPVRPVQSEGQAPCQLNCPCSTNIRDWIAPIAQREHTGASLREAYEEAWTRIVDHNPFPAVMGRICPHPCESGCNRIGKDGNVSVSALERFLGDWALEQKLRLPRLDRESRDESVAVVGAGPAGLSYAYQMARRGYRVKVFDWHPEAGGMLRYGVPKYRLPRSVLDAEIARITELGVELCLGVRIGTDLSLEELKADHQLLFLGLGTQQGRLMNIPGENGASVWVGTDFLERYNEGHALSLGEHLVVIGGGNTAIDVARTGRRSGARVTVLYRRQLEEMPAIDSEIRHAREEGVDFEDLATPLEISRDASGALRGLTVQRLHPGKQDDDGRHVPQAIPGDTYYLDASAVVIAISQVTDWTGLEDAESMAGAETTRQPDSRLTLGGDVLRLGIASQAIAEGRKCAEQARGEPPNSLLADKTLPTVKVDHYAGADSVNLTEALPDERLLSPDLETSHTISENEFLAEVQRCLSCGSCLGCYQCWMYCNAGSFTPLEQGGPGQYFSFDSDLCEGCGKCIELCPCGYLSPE
jgi:NADPH-dependent glutamate synthase beta subunit-like oxidoreductase/Pyruvate/2-oxoacid:ferredoxin oxidoreductase delta subunit